MKTLIVTLVLIASSTSFALTQPKAPEITQDMVCSYIAEDIQVLKQKINMEKEKIEALKSPQAAPSYELYLEIQNEIEKAEKSILRKRGGIRALNLLADDINCP